jgi:hypothetical protein
MDGIAKRIVMSILGMVLVLGFWTIQSKLGCGRSGAAPVAERIPSKVWEGGGGKCKLEVEVSDPAEVRLEFYRWGDSGPHHGESFHARETVPAGRHMFIIEAPPETNVSPELQIHKPQLHEGSKMAWVLTCGDKECYRHEETWDPRDQEFWFEGRTVPNAGTGEGW